MNWLITSDIHLSDRPRDAYRFGLFKWLAKQQAKYNTTSTFILGDLTQEKDNHSATLVNHTIDEMTQLRPPIYILRGNHDGYSPDDPFFRFLNCIEGFNFVSVASIGNGDFPSLIPHCRTQREFDEICQVICRPGKPVMLHQTFEGAIAETGVKLNGLKPTVLKATNPSQVWSGDVHKPQRQGIVTYIGSPYHVRFGDDFEPRVLLVKGDRATNLYFDAPRKWMLRVRSAAQIKQHKRLLKGDQIKVILELNREEALDWQQHRQAALSACKDLSLECFGIDLHIAGGSKKEGNNKPRQLRTPEQIMTAFCQHEGLSNGLSTTGFNILKLSLNQC